MKSSMYVVALAGIVSGAVIIGLPINSPAHAEQSAAVCMAGETGGDNQGQAFTIVVSEQRVAQMQQRGLSITACNGRDAEVAQIRAEMCQLAATAPTPVIARFTGLYGVSPSEMCSMTGEIIGD